MPLDFAIIKDMAQNIIGDDDPDTATDIERAINMSARDISRAHDWDFLELEDIVTTKAPYVIGTVSVSQNDTAVTGVGTAWDTGGHDGSSFKGYKFAKGYTDPYYEVAAVGSATGITLADKYRETALSGSTYILYQDLVEMPAECAEVISIKLLDEGEEINMRQRSLAAIRGHNYARSDGRPREYARYAPSPQGRTRIVLSVAPDKVYNLLVTFKQKHVDGDLSCWPDHLLDLVLERTLYWAHLRDSAQKAAMHNAEYTRKLAMAMADHKSAPTTFTFGLRQPSRPTYGGITWQGRDLEI